MIDRRTLLQAASAAFVGLGIKVHEINSGTGFLYERSEPTRRPTTYYEIVVMHRHDERALTKEKRVSLFKWKVEQAYRRMQDRMKQDGREHLFDRNLVTVHGPQDQRYQGVHSLMWYFVHKEVP